MVPGGEGADGISNRPLKEAQAGEHKGDDALKFYTEREWPKCDVIVSNPPFLGGKLIGFVKLTCDQARTQAGLMHIVSMVQHRDKAPTNALIAQPVRSCAERGIRYLMYQNFTRGNKKPDSLTNFKEVNGFQRVNLPRYYVPLTPIGWAALRLGLHHKLADRLPESLAARLRELRTSWYHRRFRSVVETV